MLSVVGDHRRNSHVIIPSIIKFLFYLSKQKDKKLITVPKIINITDTLLANGGNVRGSTEALLELAHEFFFYDNMMMNVGGGINSDSGVARAGDGSGGGNIGDVIAGNDTTKSVGDAETKINRMEANTQKEVAFSMLLKFLDDPKVILCLNLFSSENFSLYHIVFLLSIRKRIKRKFFFNDQNENNSSIRFRCKKWFV